MLQQPRITVLALALALTAAISTVAMPSIAHAHVTNVEQATTAQSTKQDAVRQLEQFLEQLDGPDSPPGPAYAVVVVSPDKVLLRHITGLARADSNKPADADTAFYIASQTKAYMGLLAATLDARGILKLDRSIKDYWPEIVFPAGVDPAEYTLGDLLSHKVPIESDYITTLEAYVGGLSPAEYATVLATHGNSREPGFRYANIGYNVYAAILQHVTGRSWQDWLQRELTTPLQLRHTAARTSALPAGNIAWRHSWMGDEAGWQIMPPKADSVMHSAGGLMTSVNDMATWLQLQLVGKGPTGSGITLAIVQQALRRHANYEKTSRNAYELPCDGYALGWNICDFNGHVLYIHGGSYAGARSMMAFSPDLQRGIGVFSNSDNATDWLTSRTVTQYFQYLTDDPKAQPMAALRKETYPKRIVQLLTMRRDKQRKARADASWQGWKWKPSDADLAALAGTYGNDDPHKLALVRWDGKVLQINQGETRATLEPAAPGLFGAIEAPLDAPKAVQFGQDAEGKTTLEWNDDHLVRPATAR